MAYLLVSGALAAPVRAQSPSAPSTIRLGGLAYVDYYYQITSSDPADEGRNGFTYRRLYLTADATLSNAFRARARLEARDSNLGERGPQPFVKDLYLTWDVGGGHALTMGVTSPPVFEISEAIWGYRAFEATLLDLSGIAASRDFGLRADGPLVPGGAVRYALMAGNDSGVFPEDDGRKRLYGRLEARPLERRDEQGRATEYLVLTLAGNYAGFERRVEVPDHEYVLGGLIGYVSGTWRAGIEGFLRVQDYGATHLTAVGASAFGSFAVVPSWSVVGRVDRLRDESRSETSYSTLGLLGVDYRPHPRVHLIPNVRLGRTDGEGRSDVLARFTLWFDF